MYIYCVYIYNVRKYGNHKVHELRPGHLKQALQLAHEKQAVVVEIQRVEQSSA